MNKPFPFPRFFCRQLLFFFETQGRKKLPWSSLSTSASISETGYKTLVSEIMLQQTTVSTVLNRFPLFIEKFPNIQSLAQATEQEVLKAWEGLGYYQRARSLHHSTKEIVLHYGGQVPPDRVDRLKLKGVGPSTASALGAFIYKQKEPIWDANVQRVFKRFLGDEVFTGFEKNWYENAQKYMPSQPDEIPAYTQAIMDLGATVCIPQNPKCSSCPLIKKCAYNKIIKQAATQQAIPPNKQKKEKGPAKSVLWKHWVILIKNNSIALVPSKEKGVWPGLWQFPDFHTDKSSYFKVIEGSHELTHRRVVYSISVSKDFHQPDKVIEANLSTNWVWVPFSSLDKYPFPKPLALFLASSPKKAADFKKMLLKEIKKDQI